MVMRRLVLIGLVASALVALPEAHSVVAAASTHATASLSSSTAAALPSSGKPDATVSGWYQQLAFGRVQFQVRSNAKKVQVSYRTAKGKMRTKTYKVRGGAVVKTLRQGSSRIKARGKGTRTLRTSPWKSLPLRITQRPLKLPLLAHSYDATCAVQSNGTVKCWGYINPDTGEPSLVPVQVLGVSGAVSVAMTDLNVCALLANGTVKCWGRDQFGLMGDGPNVRAGWSIPRTVPGLAGVRALTGSLYHLCALLGNGTVKCWGIESAHRHGYGINPVIYRTSPRLVPGLAGVVGLRSGEPGTCALLATGTVKCMGFDSKGRVTDTVLTGPLLPIRGVAGGVTDLAVGGESACVTLSSGSVKCWQLRREGTKALRTAVTVPGVAKATRVSAAGATCVTLRSGAVTCWGFERNGVLGNGQGAWTDRPPAPVPGVSRAFEVAVGYQSACAALTIGAVTCWGASVLGDGNPPIIDDDGDPDFWVPRTAVKVVGMKVKSR